MTPRQPIVPPEGWCPECGGRLESEQAYDDFACPRCGLCASGDVMESIRKDRRALRSYRVMFDRAFDFFFLWFVPIALGVLLALIVPRRVGIFIAVLMVLKVVVRIVASIRDHAKEMRR